ncbi:hypothetical protein NPIL_9551, partial [Nephila pilipes]
LEGSSPGVSDRQASSVLVTQFVILKLEGRGGGLVLPTVEDYSLKGLGQLEWSD